MRVVLRRVTDTESGLLEVRLFKLHPGTRAEFDRISRDGTIPMMRRFGITVLSHGPMLNDEDGYLLVRAFQSEEQRVALARSFYASQEWEANYERPVTAMIADYHTAVVPATDRVLGLLGAA